MSRLEYPERAIDKEYIVKGEDLLALVRDVFADPLSQDEGEFFFFESFKRCTERVYEEPKNWRQKWKPYTYGSLFVVSVEELEDGIHAVIKDGDALNEARYNLDGKIRSGHSSEWDLVPLLPTVKRIERWAVINEQGEVCIYDSKERAIKETRGTIFKVAKLEGSYEE